MTSVHLINDSPASLWGLTGRERLIRQLRALGVTDFVSGAGTLPNTGRVLLLRADHVMESRALKGLLALDGVLKVDDRPVAAHVDATRAGEALEALAGKGDHDFPNINIEGLQAYEHDLRKSEPPLVAHVTTDNAAELEKRLYGASYKGITDFVTKWWWPRPAKAAVRWCSRTGVTPNMVTITGFVLMLAVCWLFYHGQYAAGLALGWFMTYLDTVDGKLARVTVQSSPVGHLLDHGMDILHPPFWYLFWGMSLVDFQPVFGIGQTGLYIAIFAGYIGGRVVEALFNLLGETSIFAWRPFDAYFRLYTARRNPCLVLLTLAWLAGNPAAGLWLVAGWTVLSTVIMAGRLLYGVRIRLTEGRLSSWLAAPEAARRHPRAYASFSGTRGAYG